MVSELGEDKPVKMVVLEEPGRWKKDKQPLPLPIHSYVGSSTGYDIKLSLMTF
jgi:hypothetical protein